jgi:teichuronic acid biosynthesis protein TuaE
MFPVRFLLPLVGLFILERSRHSTKSVVRVKPYFWFFGLWLVYAVASLIWASDKTLAIRDICFLATGVLQTVVIVYYLVDPNHLLRLYEIWLCVLGACVGIGIWEITTGNHLAVSALVNYQSEYPGVLEYDRIKYWPTAVFHNPNDFATILALSVPFVVVWIKYNRRLLYRIFGVGLLLASLFVLIFTESRANYYAVLLGLAFQFVVLQKTCGKIVSGVTVTLILLGLLLAAPLNIIETFSFVKNQLTSLTFENLTVRRNLSMYALQSLITTYGVGLGAGNVEVFIEGLTHDTEGITNLHNWWLEILADYGIIIFIGYALFYMSILLNLHRVFQKANTRGERMLAEALLTGLVGFAIGAVSSSSVLAILPMWMYFGFALALLNVSRNNR